jgi:class 3 adenylate cyclase
MVSRGQNPQLDSLKGVLAKEKVDTVKINLELKIANLYVIIDPQQAIFHAAQAMNMSEKRGYQPGIALAYKYNGSALYTQGKYPEALESWNHAMDIFKKLNNKEGTASILNNIGSIYLNQGNDTKALEYLFEFLKNAEQTGNERLVANAYNNIGAVYQHKSINYDKALKYYYQALPLYVKIIDLDGFETVCGNIGEIYMDRKNIDSAMYYFKKAEVACQGTADIAYALMNIGRAYKMKGANESALHYEKMAYDSARKDSSKLYMVLAAKEIAAVQLKMGKTATARKTFLRAERLAKEIQSSYDLKDIYTGLSRIYSGEHDYAQAFTYQSLLLEIKDSIYNKETDQKLARYEFDFEIEKKQNQINLLEKNRQLQELDLERQKFAKNAFIIGFGLILVIAFILFRNYRNKVKVNKILDSQKAQIEALLRNILPDEVAKELQTSGKATPRYCENVSVLFTDFKGFTKLADSLSPEDIVSELNTCFMAFDDIIEKYNLEKIKTIGDSYMCASGILSGDKDYISNMVRAAMEIQEFIESRNQLSLQVGLEPWNIRIGIHVGPVVAGVVGRKKYAYDIWGGTVNIASRMESNGEIGRVNISAAVYEQIRDEYACTHRGKIHAKNIGDIDMYFVDYELASRRMPA